MSNSRRTKNDWHELAETLDNGTYIYNNTTGYMIAEICDNKICTITSKSIVKLTTKYNLHMMAPDEIDKLLSSSNKLSIINTQNISLNQ